MARLVNEYNVIECVLFFIFLLHQTISIINNQTVNTAFKSSFAVCIM